MKNSPCTQLLRLTGLISLVLSLSACGNTSNDTDTSDTTSETSTETTNPDTPEEVRIGTSSFTVGEYIFDIRAAGPIDGPGVILLHGFPQTSMEWEAQLLALGEAGYRAVAPNQRGYSPLARPEDQAAYALPNLIEDVLGLADVLGYETFHLVGHDWGASVAWSTAGAAPERLKSLTTISVPHLDAFALTRNDPESCQYSASSYMDFFVQPNSQDILLANDTAQLRAIYGNLPQSHIDDYLAVLTQPGALKAGLDWYRANITTDTTASLGVITTPTLYIWSTGDTALCEDGAYLTEDYVSGPYQFEIIEDVDHWVPENASDRVSEVLIEHLNRFEEEAGSTSEK